MEILLWGEDRHLFWGLPGSLVLCLSQPRGFPPSHLRVQGPEPRGRRHRGDHLSPPRPGLCDECAGHLEEVGDWSQPGCPLAGCVPALRRLYLYLHLHMCGFATGSRPPRRDRPDRCCPGPSPRPAPAQLLWDAGDLASSLIKCQKASLRRESSSGCSGVIGSLLRRSEAPSPGGLPPRDLEALEHRQREERQKLCVCVYVCGSRENREGNSYA